jgi:hypothetical protein
MMPSSLGKPVQNKGMPDLRAEASRDPVQAEKRNKICE